MSNKLSPNVFKSSEADRSFAAFTLKGSAWIFSLGMLFLPTGLDDTMRLIFTPLAYQTGGFVAFISLIAFGYGGATADLANNKKKKNYRGPGGGPGGPPATT